MLLRGHEGNVNGVAYSPDETMAISAGREDMVLILWDLTTGKEIRRFEGAHRTRAPGCVPPRWQAVLSASEDKHLDLVGCRHREAHPHLQEARLVRSKASRCAPTAPSLCPPRLIHR